MNEAPRLLDLIDQLETIYSGLPWFGPSWMDTLERIGPEALRCHLPRGAGIIESLWHVTAWRVFVTRRLQGQEAYDLAPGQDWPGKEEEPDWEALVHTFADSQRELLEALADFPASMLDEEVPGRGYSWAFMLQGLIHHDIYHMAQINLVARQQSTEP